MPQEMGAGTVWLETGGAAGPGRIFERTVHCENSDFLSLCLHLQNGWPGGIVEIFAPGVEPDTAAEFTVDLPWQQRFAWYIFYFCIPLVLSRLWQRRL